MATLIEFAGVTFNTGEPDADGCLWSMRVPQGWGRPPQQVDVTEPTVAPGGDQSSNRRKPWPLLARWRVRCPDEATAWATYNRCHEMPGDGLDRAATLLVGEAVPKWVSVIQTAADITEPRGNLLVFAEVELSALVPFKRGADERSITLAPGETKTLRNAGTRAATLVVTTTGAGTVQLRQNASGQVMRTRTSVATGTVFDCREQSVTTSAGLDIFPMGSPSEWLSIPGGTLTIPADTGLTNQGTAPVTVSCYDTY
ncbi:hypothetical protein [Intrasporangium flavum]|uniref:hypothetical protein n=1 Tax=Intrasporangium flavum TaxID=1428657 RepID=UPI00096CFA0C|nr:hypothetical protein [Intrasporangium flavum]